MLTLPLFVYSIYDMFRLVPCNHQGIRVQHGVLRLLYICYHVYVNNEISMKSVIIER
jgi:hypothetical protein